ncbi:hypothetical protein ADUPG1_008013 [Aduncisulcus paluster]|uniref:Uncharacterized protein n=1 Tax=Aduncisulcus paluster TaxID=2918883 RepID=A0ABQ5KQE9_9EUKA|nr:hypothetical protein ADUPG1_008013 [Aduncisulcus paluster]
MTLTDPADGYLHLTGGGFAIGNSRMSFSGTKLTLDGSVDDLDLYVTGDFTADGSATIGDYTLTSAASGLSITGIPTISSGSISLDSLSSSSVVFHYTDGAKLTYDHDTTTFGLTHTLSMADIDLDGVSLTSQGTALKVGSNMIYFDDGSYFTVESDLLTLSGELAIGDAVVSYDSSAPGELQFTHSAAGTSLITSFDGEIIATSMYVGSSVGPVLSESSGDLEISTNAVINGDVTLDSVIFDVGTSASISYDSTYSRHVFTGSLKVAGTKIILDGLNISSSGGTLLFGAPIQSTGDITAGDSVLSSSSLSFDSDALTISYNGTYSALEVSASSATRAIKLGDALMSYSSNTLTLDHTVNSTSLGLYVDGSATIADTLICDSLEVGTASITVSAGVSSIDTPFESSGKMSATLFELTSDPAIVRFSSAQSAYLQYDSTNDRFSFNKDIYVSSSLITLSSSYSTVVFEATSSGFDITSQTMILSGNKFTLGSGAVELVYDSTNTRLNLQGTSGASLDVYSGGNIKAGTSISISDATITYSSLTATIDKAFTSSSIITASGFQINDSSVALTYSGSNFNMNQPLSLASLLIRNSADDDNSSISYESGTLTIDSDVSVPSIEASSSVTIGTTEIASDSGKIKANQSFKMQGDSQSSPALFGLETIVLDGYTTPTSTHASTYCLETGQMLSFLTKSGSTYYYTVVICIEYETLGMDFLIINATSTSSDVILPPSGRTAI